VQQPVEDGICDSWFADVLVPSFDRELRRDDGPGDTVPVFEQLELRSPALMCVTPARGAESVPNAL